METNTRTKLMFGVTLLAALVLGPAFAGPVAIPNQFEANTPAVADEVNDNFAAITEEVNDNDSRIDDNKDRIDANTSRVESLEALTAEDLRIVRGVINADRSIHAGTGFVVDTFGTGNYVIDFSPSFSGPATFIITPYNKNVASQSVQIGGSLSANIALFNAAGAGIDAPFAFVAIGPR